MKLFNSKDDKLYLTREQWTKVFVAFSIITLVLYSVAMVFSLCGSKYFILNYQNEQMDKIEAFLHRYSLTPLMANIFITVEFVIVLSFVLKKFPKWYYILVFYAVPLIFHYLITPFPQIIHTIYPFIFHITIPLIEQLITNKKIIIKDYLKCLLRLLIATIIVYTFQVMIYVIKDGNFSFENNVMSLSAHFIYAIEFDIALSVILYTIVLLFDKEKGDRQWTTGHTLGLSSQTSTKKSLKSKQKKLTKTQSKKLKLLYLRFYLTQIGAFLLLMVLPFILGKVFEFLVVYLSFAIIRYILGFKYSLHFKKEIICITVGAVVFGILSLAVPFFYIVVIMAIAMGASLAVLLHLSYKYKGMWLFAQIAKPDKFAELYVLMDGNLDRHHVEIMCLHRGVPKENIDIICDFTDGNKKSYIAKKNNYSEKTIERIINEAIDTIKQNS